MPLRLALGFPCAAPGPESLSLGRKASLACLSMNSASNPNHDDAQWNHWFVGFCDGEASFTFRCDRSTRSARPRFKLCLQQDAELIQTIFNRFNSIGSAPGEFPARPPLWHRDAFCCPR